MKNKRDRFVSWVTQGKQLGKSFVLERDGKRYYASVAIQRQGERYRVVADEIEESRMAADVFTREESRLFGSLDEAIAFIEATTPVTVDELAPSKGQKWFV